MAPTRRRKSPRLQSPGGVRFHEHGWVNSGERRRHYGLAEEKIAKRAVVLALAHAAHPERFTQGAPQPPALPKEVWINKPRIEVNRSNGPVLGSAAKIDAQTSPRANDLDLARDSRTPELEGSELIEVAQ